MDSIVNSPPYINVSGRSIDDPRLLSRLDQILTASTLNSEVFPAF